VKSSFDKSGKQGAWVLLVAVFAAGLYSVVRGCGVNEESRVRAAVYAGVVALEKKNMLKCASMVSESFRDKHGNDRASLLGGIKVFFNEYQDLKIDVKQLKIEIKGPQADCRARFVCYFKNTGDAQLYYDNGTLDLRFQKEEGLWKVRGLEYSGSNATLFLQSVA
jgi:hypothetical protein